MASGKKTVLITGCTPGGIGHALALKFHEADYHVIATARRAEVLEELTKMGMSAVSLDVTSSASIEKCKAQVTEITGGTLDILVNNAGLLYMLPATDIDMDGVRATFETNVFGVMAMCQAFIPLLMPARGLVVQISSISAVAADLYASVYSATKGALNSYSRSLRLELRPFGVRVMVAVTGTVRSRIAAKISQRLPEGSLYAPVDDLYVKRHRFSQETVPMDTDVYAAKIVAQAVKGEGWLGGWLGRSPDWYWTGGIARRTWLAQYLPTSWTESMTAALSGNDEITKRIHAAQGKTA
ncbi:short chain dehydrogenase/reductase, putative [Cordyceps militaris CM01]|uniref:Short chain dehydrogenase/reductase, putative n=1 Tax=Cordyceps militaris (strain CM01) TaxID=983644 RepID=G3JL46_CORMM|nr:short chain dehydrogenase/reductase, putative [Cordyceps militaris CM01]EGX90420.1 short chain dehydrogenase/reductase, putative [Cordyceps militaris CM01]